MTTQYRPDELEAQAARAMRAALERFIAWNDKDQAEGRLEDALNAARAAIAQAKAAGIPSPLRSDAASKAEG